MLSLIDSSKYGVWCVCAHTHSVTAECMIFFYLNFTQHILIYTIAMSGPTQADLQAIKDKYSETEIKEYANMFKTLASKAVICALKSLVENSDAIDNMEKRRLMDKLDKTMPYNYCGYASIGMKETSHKLNIQLSIVERGYTCSIEVPSADYAKDLFDKYNLLKECALLYWQSYRTLHANLVSTLCEKLEYPSLDLVIDKDSPTTMYFDPLSKERIGVFCYYVNPDGTPIRKMSKQN